MPALKCIVTVPDIGQNYDNQFARLADLGVEARWERDLVKSTNDEKTVAEACKGYDIVVASNEKWGAPSFAICDTLHLLVRYGIGFDNVDLAAATAAGIPVTNLPGCNAESVAEQTVLLMLAALRDIVGQDQTVKKGVYDAQTAMTGSIQGKTVGLLGCGHIGKAVARMLHGFPCSVVAFDLAPDAEFAAKYDLRYAPFEEVLTRSDIVSVHLPLTPDTKWTINRESIARMKPGVVVVNTSRGGLVNSDDLAAALKSGRVRAAGLDVFENEVGSDRPLGYQFLDLDNVVLTPHSASLTYETYENMMRCAVDAIGVFLAGRPLPGPLNQVPAERRRG